ncbi:hypothetical protein [Caulobacter sp. NIBR1757]|uniref:hypothetical protein n=1 Tax=Caulobacter sp. NIBR1757 TaxID=3016000 RepID=UPI0022F1194F|nr:hypothetical protein [Caulobacter sp. NIBR1757]
MGEAIWDRNCFRHPGRSEAKSRDPGATPPSFAVAVFPSRHPLGPGSALRAVRDDAEGVARFRPDGDGRCS